MSEATFKLKVPKLRFPEFEREWEERQLSSFVDPKRKVTYGIVQPGEFVDEGVPLVRGGDYSDGWVTLDKIVRVTHEIDRPYRRSKLRGGDLLLTIVGANTGTVAVVPDWLEDANITQTTARIAIDKAKADPGFIEQALQTRAGRREVYKFIKGAAQPGLNLSDVEKFVIAAPKLVEQSRVAGFLKAIDQRIHLMVRKLEKFEAHKNGLMQRLFSQELRFTRDDGSSYPDWEEKRLSELAGIRKGEQRNRDTLADDGEYPVINGGVTPSGFTDSANSMGGTITISEGGNSCGHVAWQEVAFWLGGHCYAIEPKSDATEKAFLFQVLKHNQTAIMRLRVGSGLPNIQKGDLQKLNLSLPHSSEQKKIAVFLTALDGKIEAVVKQIDAMQRFKKGLLQQMFV